MGKNVEIEKGNVRKMVLTYEALMADKVFTAKRMEDFRNTGLVYTKLRGGKVAIFRIDGRSGEDIINFGGFNPRSLGEGIKVIEPSNIPDHLRQHGELPLNSDFDPRKHIEAGSDKAARTSDHIFDKNIPSNPGANMGLNCWATNPYGGLSAAGEPGAKRWIAVAATDQGIPITALYQTAEMLTNKLKHLKEEREKGGQQQIVQSFDIRGNSVLNIPVTVDDKNGRSRNISIPIVTSASGTQYILKEEWGTVNYCRDKNGEIIGELVDITKDSNNTIVSGTVIKQQTGKKSTQEKLKGKSIESVTFASMEQSKEKLGTYKNGIYTSEKGETINAMINNAGGMDNIRLEYNEKNLEVFIKEKLGRDSPDEFKGMSMKEFEGLMEKLPKTEKAASFEFEFSDFRKGLDDTLMWAEIECINGTSYKVNGVKVNPYFDTEKNPKIYGDRHLQDLLSASEKLGTVVSVPSDEIVTPLQNELVIKHIPDNLMDMESLMRGEKRKIVDRIMEMSDKTVPINTIEGVKAYSTKNIINQFATAQSQAASACAALIKDTSTPLDLNSIEAIKVMKKYELGTSTTPKKPETGATKEESAQKTASRLGVDLITKNKEDIGTGKSLKKPVPARSTSSVIGR